MKKLITYFSGSNPDLVSRQSRDDHDSILSRFCLVSLICILMLTLGVGSAWGTTGSYSLSGSQFGSAKNNYQTSEATLTGSNSSSWKVNGYGVVANTSLSIGKGGANYLQTPLCPGYIKSIQVTWTGNADYYLALQTPSGRELEAKKNGGTSSAQTYTFEVCGSFSQLRLVGRRSSGTNNAEAKMTSITVNYGCDGTKLDIPDVTATPASTKLTLSWPDVDNATKYKVSWNGGAFTDATSPFTKTSLTNGTTYTWAVIAIGDGSTYCNSDIIEGSTKPGSPYTITWVVNGETYATTKVASGDHLVLPASPSPCTVGKVFAGWSETNIGSTPTDTKPTFVSSQTTISANKTYYAVFATRTANSYTKGDINDLFPGQTVLIVNTSSNVVLSDEEVSGQSNKRLQRVAVSISSNTITSMSNSHLIWTVENRGLKYNFKTGTGYLRATDSGNDKLSCASGADPWTLTNNSGTYYMNSNNSGSSRLEYYSSYNYFTTYGTNSTGNAYAMAFFVPTCTQYFTSCAAACDKPSALTKGSINASSQTVSWTAPGATPATPAGGYYIAYTRTDIGASAPSAPGNSVYESTGIYTVATADTESANITCNTAGTYYWWVRSKCNADNNNSCSDWVAGTAFTMMTIYLKTNANWRTDSPKFAAYFWDATNNGWTPFMGTQTDCETGVYKVVFPTDYTNMKFVRCNPADGTPQFGEGHAWDETGDLTLPANKDCFTLPADAWSGTTNGTSDANWSVYAQKYQISFNLNKGGASFSTYPASAPDSRCVATGSTTAAPTDPVALGKVINGWYKESGCSNQWVFASQTVSANQELFANWEDVATKTIYLDASASLSGGNRWDQDGATDLVMFAHAYIDNTGDPGLYYNVKMTAVSTCQPHVYSCAIPGNATHVSFARCANGTTELPVSWTNPPVYNQIAGKTVESGKNLYTITDWGAATLESSPFSPTSYTMSYAAGTTPNKSGTAITGSKSSENKACDATYTLPSSAVFSVTGYRQTAWTTSDGGTQTHAFSSSYTTNADQAFYPVWSVNTYTVTYNMNGGSAGTGTANQAFTYDVAQPLRSCGFTAPGEHKYFAGWDTNSGAANPTYSAGQSVSNLSSTNGATVTLYAIWKDHTFTNYRTLCAALNDIVLDDGLVATTNNGSAKVANNGTTLTNIVAPTKSGYDVDYYCTTSGLATKIAESTGALSASITVGGNAWTNGSSQWVRGAGETFYTKWKIHTYNLTYEGLEGATHSNPATYTVETATITLTDPSARTGYTFTGWTCGGAPITTIALGSTGDKTITANWSINTPNLAVSTVDHVVITATPASELAIAEGANRNVNYNKTVTLNCTPDAHWSLAWDVYKTGESSTKVALTGDGDGATFTMPDYNVTVTAVMTEATYHTATFKNNGAVIAGYDGVKTYDGEQPSAPTLTDVTDACDKTDCNKFYGWIAEAGIWDKTINSVAGKTIYRTASSIPVVSGANVVYHAVWAKGTAAPALSAPTPIIYWARQSIAASTNISATSGTGTLNSNVAFTDDTYEKVYNSGSLSSAPTITLSSLNMSSATGSTVNISFFTRGTNSSAGDLTVKYTNSGIEYTANTVTVVSKQVCYHEVSGIPKTATQIKLVHSQSGGNLAIGTIKIFEPNTTSYSFTELTSSNTEGWSNGDWDGNYIITNGSTNALNGNGIGEKNFATVSASDGVISTTNIGAAFIVTWVSGSGFKIQGVGSGDYLNTASNSVAPSESIVYLSGMAYNGITDGSSNTLRYNSNKFGFYASAGTAIKLYKIMSSFTEFRITCCDKAVTIGTPTKTGSGTVTFASGGDAYAAGDEVETCAGETTITATVTPTNGYQCTVLSFTRSDEAALTPDPAISVPFTGAQNYDLPFERNADGVTLNTSVTFVALIDHYIDNMHYNTTQNKSGNYGTVPTLSDESKGEQCTGLHYKFIGWIPETDMNMTTGVPTTTANMVAGGATGKYATGTNYYAIWAEEE